MGLEPPESERLTGARLVGGESSENGQRFSSAGTLYARCFGSGKPLNRAMQNSTYTFLVAPLIGWLTVVCLLVVAYLASLMIEEKRRNRRMNQERQRLGLRPA